MSSDTVADRELFAGHPLSPMLTRALVSIGPICGVAGAVSGVVTGMSIPKTLALMLSMTLVASLGPLIILGTVRGPEGWVARLYERYTLILALPISMVLVFALLAKVLRPPTEAATSSFVTDTFLLVATFFPLAASMLLSYVAFDRAVCGGDRKLLRLQGKRLKELAPRRATWAARALLTATALVLAAGIAAIVATDNTHSTVLTTLVVAVTLVGALGSQYLDQGTGARSLRRLTIQSL